MSDYAIDASAAAEYLLRTRLGVKLAELLEDGHLFAPALLDAEVLSVFRRGVLQGKLDVPRAELAIEDLRDWPIERVPHPPLLLKAWRHRHNVSAYDALYVAVAEVYGVPLVTADGPLARAPVPGVVVQNLRIG